jgi:hypothetical protein
MHDISDKRTELRSSQDNPEADAGHFKPGVQQSVPKLQDHNWVGQRRAQLDERRKLRLRRRKIHEEERARVADFLKVAEEKFRLVADMETGAHTLNDEHTQSLAEWTWRTFHPYGRQVKRTFAIRLSRRLQVHIMRRERRKQLTFEVYRKWFQESLEEISTHRGLTSQ